MQNSHDIASSGNEWRKIAGECSVAARQSTRESLGAYSEATRYHTSVAKVVQSSMKVLRQSDALLQWCQTYGPRPKGC